MRRVKERFDRGLVLQLTRPLIDVSPVLVAQTVILLSRERGEAGAEVLIMRNRGVRESSLYVDYYILSLWNSSNTWESQKP